MDEIGGSQRSRGGDGLPRVFFHEKQGLSRNLFQMGSLKGLSNPGYDPEPATDDTELEIDYNSFADDQEFKDNREKLPTGAEKDSGRGSHEETVYVNDKVSVASFSRASKGTLEDELGYSSDESVGHFRPGFSSSEDSLTESNFEVGGRPPSLAEDTL